MYLFATYGISPSLKVFPRTDENIQAVREACTALLRQEVIIFSWCSRGFSLIKRNLKKWNLSRKSSYITRLTKVAFIWGLRCATEDIPERMHVLKVVWVKHYGDLTVLNWRRWLRYCSFVELSQQASFDFFILFSLWFWRSWRLDAWFWFSLQSSSFCNLVGFSR